MSDERVARSPHRPGIFTGFRLAADIAESIRPSGPGYNARVEQALREVG